jgi:hypothetical protein
MEELSLIFSSPPAAKVFYIGSIMFMLAYVVGFMLVRAWRHAAGQRAAIRHGIPAAAALLIAVASGAAVHWATIKATHAASPNMARSISPEELHRSVDAAALPVLEVREPF